MINLLGTEKRGGKGFLDGHFLIAMPSMLDPNFARAVIYVCAHSEDGAMGFVINRPQDVSFSDILLHLKIVSDESVDDLPAHIIDFPVRSGGPVDNGRGFVIHSEDYHCNSSIPLSEEICLSTTQDVIRAISKGRGPQRAAMMLGYAGWRPGQLEQEIGQNVWLTCPAHESLIFEGDLDTKYDRAMALLGINPTLLSNECGHA
jgi:putative transcriptional regulator